MDRHGDRGTLSFMCIWHLEVPSPDLYRFLWCLWTDAILRLRRGTKRGEFWKKGSLPGSDLSYGHNTGFHKIESLFLILERDSGESGLEREVPFTSACIKALQRLVTWPLPPSNLAHFGSWRAIEEMNISGEQNPLVASDIATGRRVKDWAICRRKRRKRRKGNSREKKGGKRRKIPKRKTLGPVELVL